MLERVQERVKLDNGAVVEVYRLPRLRKRPWRCRITFADGTQREGGDAQLISAALRWGIETARGEGA